MGTQFYILLSIKNVLLDQSFDDQLTKLFFGYKIILENVKHILCTNGIVSNEIGLKEK